MHARHNIYSLIFAILFLVHTYSAEAHGNSLSIQKVVGDYLIDMHYPYPFKAEQPIWLNFFLSHAESGTPALFSDIDISVLKDNEPILKTNVNRKRGIATGVIIDFPKPGDYDVYIAFNDEANKLVETSFPITVGKNDLDASRNILGIELGKEVVIGALLGIFGAFVVAKLIG